MLEHDRRILAFAGDLPDALTEFACLGGPFLLAGGVVDQGWDSPVAELITVDVADRAEFFRILPALVFGNDSDRLGAGMRGCLNSLRELAPGAAPVHHMNPSMH